MSDTFEQTLANLRAMVEQGQGEQVVGILTDVVLRDPDLTARLKDEMVGWAIGTLIGDPK